MPLTDEVVRLSSSICIEDAIRWSLILTPNRHKRPLYDLLFESTSLVLNDTEMIRNLVSKGADVKAMNREG